MKESGGQDRVGLVLAGLRVWAWQGARHRSRSPRSARLEPGPWASAVIEASPQGRGG